MDRLNCGLGFFCEFKNSVSQPKSRTCVQMCDAPRPASVALRALEQFVDLDQIADAELGRATAAGHQVVAFGEHLDHEQRVVHLGQCVRGHRLVGQVKHRETICSHQSQENFQKQVAKTTTFGEPISQLDAEHRFLPQSARS